MRPKALLQALMLCGIFSYASAPGCAHGITSESTKVRLVQWEANLDDCREVSLSVYQSHDETEGEPESEYEELALEVRPRKHLQFKRVLKSIDEKSGDRDTGKTTGPDDEPPSWATLDGGTPLNQ